METLLVVLLIIAIIILTVFNLICLTDLAATIYKGQFNYEKAMRLHTRAYRWSHKLMPTSLADFITGRSEFEKIAD